jgi:hypothetical protein
MIFISGSLLQPKQIRLTELFTVERVLSSRGFRVASEGSGLDTIISRNIWHGSEADLIFKIFDNREERKNLLGLICGQKSASHQIDELQELEDLQLTREAFSHTFEWYVGELMVRRFGSFSSSYGVEVPEVKRNTDGGTIGDYDVLSVLGTMQLLYFECKSGGFTGKKISNMVQRAHSLHVEASIMFAESFTEKSLKAKLQNVECPWDSGPRPLLKVRINGVSESDIYQWDDTFFLCARDTDFDVEAKIRTALRLLEFRKKHISRSMVPNQESYHHAGYEMEVLTIPFDEN